MFEHPALPANDLGQDLRQISRRNARQKSELSQIDAEDRNLPFLHLQRGPQDRAVASQDDSDVGVDATQVALILKILKDDIEVLIDDWP